MSKPIPADPTATERQRRRRARLRDAGGDTITIPLSAAALRALADQQEAHGETQAEVIERLLLATDKKVEK